MIIKIPPHLNYMYLAKCMCSRNCRAQRQWSRLQFKIQPLIIVVGKNTHPVIHQFYKGLRLCWLAYNSTTVLPRRPAVITSSTALVGSHTLPVNRNHRRVAVMTVCAKNRLWHLLTSADNMATRLLPHSGLVYHPCYSYGRRLYHS